MPQTYQLSPAADQDLVDIWTYSAQQILGVRAGFSESSLADLHDPLTMPPKLGARKNE